MNTDLIFKRLSSTSLFNSEWLETLNEPAIRNLLQKFGLYDDDTDTADHDDLRDILFAFISSYDGHNVYVFHRIFEVLAVFPNLDFELVQSLLESNEGKLSGEMIGEFVELSAEIEGDLSIEHGSSTAVSISTMSVAQVLESSTPLTFDRKTVLIITDDEGETTAGTGSASTAAQVLGVAMSSSYGLNALYSMQDSSFSAKSKYAEWGLHDLHVCYRRTQVVTARGQGESERGGGDLSTATRPIYFTSVVFDYSLCLERVVDMFHYGWSNVKGGAGVATWTPALEEAMLHLLIAVDDDLVLLVRSWKSMMTGFGSMGGAEGMSSDLENMLQMVQADATDALRTQSANAIGRLHQVLSQFADMASGPMGAMVNIPPIFLHCIEHFVLAKLQAAKAVHVPFVVAMAQLIEAGRKYSQHLKAINFNTTKIKDLDDFIALFENKIPLISTSTSITAVELLAVETFFTSLTPSDVKALEALKPSQLDSLMSSGNSGHQDTDALCFLPALSLQDIASPALLSKAVTSLAEKTFNDAITLGAGGEVALGGYTMTPANRSVTCAVLSSLLNAGVAYVATKETAKLMGHLPMLRSTLPLQPSTSHGGNYQRYLSALPVQLRKRIKDMKRVFRNKIKKPLSFRVNFDVSHAVALLREHHGVECWVGQELEQVWQLMAATSPPQLMVFELYYGDTLVAADFAHPICGGRAVYVATRFSARGHSSTSGGAEEKGEEEEEAAVIRTMQPGFILALVECCWLQGRGCLLWDLGGYNLSPLMQYKLDLAGEPQPRHLSLYEFRRCCRVNKSELGDIESDSPNPWIVDTAIACDGEEAAAVSLFAGVRSGDVLIDDVKIEHLLGHHVP